MQAQRKRDVQCVRGEVSEKCRVKKVRACFGQKAERLSLKVHAKSARREMCETKKKQLCATLENEKVNDDDAI